MKLRMYLRGLGIGLFIAAVVLSFSNKKESMTDSEIIAKAKALGMEEKKTTLKEELSASEPVSDDSEDKENKSELRTDDIEVDKDQNVKALEDKEQAASENVDNDRPDDDGDIEDAKSLEDNDKAEDIDNPADNGNIEDTESTEDYNEQGNSKTEEPDNKKEIAENNNSKITITVSKGASSETVAKLLEKGGVIDSAARFDKFLCDKNYDNRIAEGYHEIPEGATYEEIARIITNR